MSDFPSFSLIWFNSNAFQLYLSVAPISLISKYFHEKKFDPQDYEVFAKFANIITQRMFEIISIKNIQQSLSSGGSIFQDYIDDQLLNPDNYKQTYPFLLKFDINVFDFFSNYDSRRSKAIIICYRIWDYHWVADL